MRSLMVVILLLLQIPAGYLWGATVISKTAGWKYFSNGTSPGASWKDPGFNDSAWLSGKAELGFGDAPFTTLPSGHLTYYFRKTCTVNKASLYSSFTLNVRRDDGIIVYVNGAEVFRDNMPAGSVTAATPSATTCSDDGNTLLSVTLPTSYFVNGSNVIAAEVHNASSTNIDLTFELELLSNVKIVPVITRGPYIQSVNTHSAILKWRTDIPASTKVKWGTTLAYGKTKKDTAAVTEHQVKLNGLLPETSYYYTIGDETRVLQGTAENHFKTAPAAGSVKKVRVWALGDFGNGSSSQQTVRDAYLNYLGTEENDLWIWLGDNAYTTGTDSEYQQFVFDIYREQFKSWNFYPAPGNHDYGQSGYLSAAALGTGFPYFSIFTLPTAAETGGVASGTEKYYSFNWSNIHFIALDSYGAYNTPGSPMYSWLQRDLSANTRQWTIVYFHHPPYSKGTHNSDAEAELIAMRQNMVPLLESYGVDLVLSGHSHTYERSYFMHGHYGEENTFSNAMIVQPGGGWNSPYIKDSLHNGTVYAVCGVGGQVSGATSAGYPHDAMFSSSSAVAGSLVLEVEGDTLTYRFLKEDGSFPDQFRMVKTYAPRYDTAHNEGHFFHLNPNPAGDMITITVKENDPVQLEVYSATGELLLTEMIVREKTMDLSSFASGVYFVKAIFPGNVGIQRLLIER